MVVPFIIGIILLIIVVYISLKVLQNVVVGVVLIALVLFASYLIFGSIPSLKDIPIIGSYLEGFISKYFPPKIPSSTGEIIAIVKNVLYKIEILSVERDSNSNLLITVVNTGKLEVSGFKVFVDGKEAKILNEPKDPLKSKEVTVLQVDWKANYSKILVKTLQASVNYP